MQQSLPEIKNRKKMIDTACFSATGRQEGSIRRSGLCAIGVVRIVCTRLLAAGLFGVSGEKQIFFFGLTEISTCTHNPPAKKESSSHERVHASCTESILKKRH